MISVKERLGQAIMDALKEEELQTGFKHDASGTPNAQ